MLIRKYITLLIFTFCSSCIIRAQCLSSANPVGGTDNLLVLEKNSLRLISFYKYGYSNHYFEKDHHSDFNMISKAYYDYLSAIIGYGLTDRWTTEFELGYYFDKTQLYNTQPSYTLSGKGLSNIIVSNKYNIYRNHVKRIYISSALGIKIPCTRTPREVDHVELPVELQPTLGAWGFVFNLSFVKENSEKGLRFFVTNKVETNFPNKDDYYLGTAVFNSFYISKHLMFPWVRGDWTTILQIRNEIRTHDKTEGEIKKYSGGTVFFIVPQINYVLLEKWYLSAMFDIPVYQYFNGIQLGAGYALTLSMSRTINF